MPTIGLFIQNLTSKPMVDSSVTSVLVQPTVLNPLFSLVPITRSVQPTVSSHVSVSSSIPLVSGQNVPPPGGQSPIFSMISSTTNVSGSQPHMVGMNQPSSSTISNHVGPARSSNVQYQQPNVGSSGSSHVHYQQPNVVPVGSSHIQYQ